MNSSTFGRRHRHSRRYRAAALPSALPPALPSLRAGALLVLALLGGCWNGDNDSIRLGDVSLGQQLLDLQRARDAGAIDEAEYRRLRSHFMELVLQSSPAGPAADGE